MSWRRRMGERAVPDKRRRPPACDTDITQTQPALTDEEIMRQDPEGVFRRLREGDGGPGGGRAA